MPSTLLGTKIGHFRIVDEIGKGGMGEVYVGFDEVLERKVALKAIRAEHRLDAESKARFLREARVLSQLAHPNICQIHDFVEGTDADFLVLELISGKSLTEEMKKALDPKKKIKIAEEIAGVLVAAHGKGVVHRDLKPDNVMLTEAGQVKVLDFGLSRSQQEEGTIELAPVPRRAIEPAPVVPPANDTEGTIGLPAEATPRPSSGAGSSGSVTTLGTVMGTLGYMSPEQANGDPATSASDIFSLGVMLQELFTGEAAFEKGGTVEQRIEKAKTGQTRAITGLDPDLTALIERMKALVPAIRPTGIEALDRLGWIEAKPARKRRRFLTAAAIVVLSAFAVGATIQAVLISKERNRANQEKDRANSEADRAQKMLKFLTDTFEVANPRKGKGPSATAKEIIDHAAEKLGEVKGQPLLQASLMHTLADIYDEMGQYGEALPLAQSALAIREKELVPNHPDVGRSLSNLAHVYKNQGKLAEAETLYKRSLEINEKALGPNHPDVASSLKNLANVYFDQGKLAQAEPLFKRSLEIREKALGPNHPDMASSLTGLANVYVSQRKLAEAETLYKRSLEIREKALGPNHLDVAMSLNNLANVYANQGRLAEAETLSKRSLDIYEKALGPNHPDVASSLNLLANVYFDQGKLAESEPLYNRSLEIYEKALGPNHPDVAASLSNLAIVYLDKGRYSEAESLLNRSLEIRDKALEPNHPDVAGNLLNLGIVALKRGQRPEALTYMRRAIPLFAGTQYWALVVEQNPDIASLRSDPEFQKIVADVKAHAAEKAKAAATASPVPAGK